MQFGPAGCLKSVTAHCTPIQPGQQPAFRIGALPLPLAMSHSPRQPEPRVVKKMGLKREDRVHSGQSAPSAGAKLASKSGFGQVAASQPDPNTVRKHGTEHNPAWLEAKYGASSALSLSRS